MILLMIFLVPLLSIAAHSVEPSCPKYDLEDRIWERVIKQELKINTTLDVFQEKLYSKVVDELTQHKGMLFQL